MGRTKNSCPDCGGAGCKACYMPEAPKVFLPVEPKPYVRTTQKQKYVDKRYLSYKDYKEHIMLLASHYLNFVPKGNAVEIDLTFKMPIPKSKAKIIAEGRPHMNTPDVDNLVKGFFDAVNGVAWEDDKQVFKVSAKKVYSQQPGIEIQVFYYAI